MERGPGAELQEQQIIKIRCKLIENNIALQNAKQEYKNAYNDYKQLEKENEDLYKHIKDMIRDSNGTLTLKNIIGGI